jgi:CIC family chloride channel protein
VSRLLVGDAFDLPAPELPTPGAPVIILFAIFGLLTGLLAAVYNHLIVAAIDLTSRLAAHPLRFAGLVGGGIGVLFFVQPQLVGEGTLLTRDVLAGDVAMWSLAGYLVVRGVLGPLSYSVGTPGGLFSPLLALGAVWGALFHGIADAVLPGAGADATAFAVVGMAAFFAGVVRAPLTGVALILEMTGATHLATVTLAASFAATLTATKVRSAPIYDTLRMRMLQRVSQ